jgi:predicted flavoprotein YhiN
MTSYPIVTIVKIGDVFELTNKVVSGLYFAGEVMDINGVTGGFDFQATWPTGYFESRLGIQSNI